ncbi:response regulator transcription factor [Marinilactibacillus kalidii]|uniref:response regulator transcription factor n=1 Tax=Marinilactibacillus kalidii TaxID=2820274 RepID=UPI001ABE1A65|nr:response regulator [Marinilactibacillus kalidii]
MYTVVLVDDEPIVREGMAYIIDWKKEGFQIVESVDNGIEGLEAIEKKQPDLVITDIRMPGLNGLEMVEAAKKRQLDAKFIVLSGYSDFEYAQKSVSLGALHYLLKPIDEEQLVVILRKIKAQLDEEQVKKKERTHIEKHLFANQLFSYIMYREKMFDLSRLTQYRSFRLMKMSSKEKRIDLQLLLDFEKTLVGEEHFYTYTDGRTILLLICNEEQQAFEHVVQCFSEVEHVQIKISSVTEKYEGLPVLYDEIRELDNLSYIFPNEQILLSSLLKTKAAYPLSVNELLKKLKKAIKDNNKEQIECVLDDYVSFFQHSNKTVEEVKRDWSYVFIECVEFLEESMHKPVKEIEKDKILSVIWKESSIEQTADFLEFTFYDFGRFFYEAFEKQDIVEEIKRYTMKNYHLNLNLKELAHHFNYSQSYLGKKFKADMKVSYHDYLDTIRLNKAKQFLEEGSLYVYEIAKMVGYANYDYFHKKFKKQFGVSPKGYQKHQQEAME